MAVADVSAAPRELMTSIMTLPTATSWVTEACASLGFLNPAGFVSLNLIEAAFEAVIVVAPVTSAVGGTERPVTENVNVGATEVCDVNCNALNVATPLVNGAVPPERVPLDAVATMLNPVACVVSATSQEFFRMILIGEMFVFAVTVLA